MYIAIVVIKYPKAVEKYVECMKCIFHSRFSHFLVVVAFRLKMSHLSYGVTARIDTYGNAEFSKAPDLIESGRAPQVRHGVFTAVITSI